MREPQATPSRPAAPAPQAVPTGWTVEQLRRILSGQMRLDPAASSKGGLSPAAYAAMAAADHSERLLTLLDEEENSALDQLLETLQTILERLERVEQKLDRVLPSPRPAIRAGAG